jgi:hypothetical protein
MTPQIEGRSRTAAIFVGIGISVVGFILIALLSIAKPAQWLVPLAMLGGAYYYRTKSLEGLWGFTPRRISNIGWWTSGFAIFFALAGSATPPPTNEKVHAEVVAANPAEAAANAANVAKEKATADVEAKREEMRDEPEKFVELENIKWSQDFSMMELSVTIKNNSEFALKDFIINCEHSGPSGTVMDSNRRKIYELIEAGKSKRINKFNMGFINSQAVSTACIVQRATIVEG